jgi:hypothetical protein
MTTLFYQASICVILSTWISQGTASEITLPEGSSPAALTAPYFPDQVHTFVWRNWSVVEPAKLAKILETSEDNVRAVAVSMGLPPNPTVPPEMKTRGYITLIRRNWHLLPYDQLLELLDMTPEQLSFTLHEDDFLWHKLGLLKPKCGHLRYSPPDEAARGRAAEIRRVVEQEFGEEIRRPSEPRFHFIEQLSRPMDGKQLPPGIVSDNSSSPSLRYVYSYFAITGDTLLNPELNPYPDGLLQRLSRVGINGVFLHVVLRDLAPGGMAFPEFGEGHERRLANLRHIVNRAKKYGIGVYLYINEPRGMPEAFFRNRPEMAGVRDPSFGLTALCTSNPTVRQWLGDALAHVFREVPDLAGVLTTTASENLTNCASRGNRQGCPRCKNRTDSDLIVEVSAVIDEGVHRGNPKAKVIVSNWGWNHHGDAPDIVAQLPKSSWLLSVSEWALPIERGGVRTIVQEYCMSAAGPGPKSLRYWDLAKKIGLKTVAKIQVNNTWELSSVPYLPVMDLVAEHCHRLALVGVDGLMLSWTLGGYPSPNLEISARFCAQPTPSVKEVLDAVAVERYGVEGAPRARKAWTAFSTAFGQFPYGCSLYTIPVQTGPANPLYLGKTGYHGTMVCFPYDDLPGWRGIYPAEVFAAQFERVASGWLLGIPDLKAAVEKAPSDRQWEAQSELRFAEAAYTTFQAVANQARFVLARDALADPTAGKLSSSQRQGLQSEIQRCLKSEIELARRLFTLTSEDSRIGFEASNHYYYLPQDLAEKVVNCRWLFDQYGQQWLHCDALPQ